MIAKGNLQRFEAVLEKGDRSLGWTVLRVPFDPVEVWTTRVRLRVRGSVNGFGFRSSLFPDPAHPGCFYLLVNRAMQTGAGARLGGRVSVELEPDLDERPAEVPEHLDALLEEAEGLRAWYEQLSEYTRREIGKWVLGVKSQEAQLRRSEAMAERLLAAMEAEIELPPVIARAFRQRPRARMGWDRMTEVQRRNELLAVFYYQTPEARERRVNKLCDAAERRAGSGSTMSAR